MSKKISTFILTAIFLGILCACGKTSQGYDTVSYTAGEQLANKEEYIDWDALELKKEEAVHEFEVYTLEYGTFSTTMTPISVSVSSMISPTPIKADYSAGKMEFVSSSIQRYQKVKKGDVIAKVKMEISDIELQELELKLTRAKENYQDFVDEHLKAQESLMNQYVYSNIQSRIRDLKYQRAGFIFSHNAQNYENQIKELEESISNLKKNQNISEIVAPEDGYIMSVNYMRTGDDIKNGQVMATYVTAEQICLEFADNLMHHGYGMTRELSVNVDRKSEICDVEIVSVTGKQLSASWNRTVSKLKTTYPADKLLRSKGLFVSGETNVMNSVLLVPAKAVIKENNNTYVTVLREDGKLEKRAFIAGGNNSVFYWVFDGLNEGTKIIIE